MVVSGLGGVDLFDPAVVEDPYPFYARLQAGAPVAPVAPGVWLVSSWALVTEAAARPDDFSSNLSTVLVQQEDGRAVPFDMDTTGTALQALATADEPAHGVHRKLVLPTLVARRIRAMRGEVADLVEQLWGQAVSAGEVDWAEAMADRLPLAVVARLIGLPDADVPLLLGWAYDSTELLGGVVTADRMEQLAVSAIELAAYLSEHYTRARRDPGANLLGDLARAAGQGGISDDVAVLMLVQLVGAGGESTAGLIGNSARLLASHPALQDSLRTDPGGIPAFLDEALRLESPFRGHYRHVRRDTALGGTQLAAGDLVLLLWGAANRDPAVFDRPDDLVLNRPNLRDHLAFGRGPHYCVGAALGVWKRQLRLPRCSARPAHSPWPPATRRRERPASSSVVTTRFHCRSTSRPDQHLGGMSPPGSTGPRQTDRPKMGFDLREQSPAVAPAGHGRHRHESWAAVRW